MSGFRITTPLDFYINELEYYKGDDYISRVNDEYVEDNPELMVSRTFDGTANNMLTPQVGSAGTVLLRKSGVAFGDGVGTLAPRTPSPRVISNAICASTGDTPNSLGLTNMFWLFGQLLDHELDITPTDPSDTANMVTPGDDAYPAHTIPFERSVYKEGVTTPRQQINNISSYVDAANVYGFNNARAMALRRLDGTGKLKTVTADNGEVIPPYNTANLENAAPTGSNPEDFFLCGDVRSNENIFLTAMHTLFIREHNRLCDIIPALHPDLVGKDELIYGKARRIVYGEMQKITYTEFLPAMIGDFANLGVHEYNDTVDPGITTEFSTVGYRFGHSMLPSLLKVGLAGTLELKDAFFRPSWIQQNGVDDLLVGAANSVCNELDVEITNAVRNFLFGAPTMSMMLDLAALNIQRGRDHGIPDYNTVRAAYNLPRVTAFSDITSDVTLQTSLSTVYASVDDIDPWVGCLAEDHLPQCAVGPLIKEIIVDQFLRLRNCDSFWWETDKTLTAADKSIVSSSTLAEIIKRNVASSYSTSIRDDVFHIV